MRVFQLRESTVYLAAGFDHPGSSLEGYVDRVTRHVFSRYPLMPQIVKLWNQRHGFDDSIVLLAHAGGKKNPGLLAMASVVFCFRVGLNNTMVRLE